MHGGQRQIDVIGSIVAQMTAPPIEASEGLSTKEQSSHGKPIAACSSTAPFIPSIIGPQSTVAILFTANNARDNKTHYHKPKVPNRARNSKTHHHKLKNPNRARDNKTHHHKLKIPNRPNRRKQVQLLLCCCRRPKDRTKPIANSKSGDQRPTRAQTLFSFFLSRVPSPISLLCHANDKSTSLPPPPDTVRSCFRDFEHRFILNMYIRKSSDSDVLSPIFAADSAFACPGLGISAKPFFTPLL
ncbi:hypothetical protein ACLOJK_008230 [Asimina triloba]